MKMPNRSKMMQMAMHNFSALISIKHQSTKFLSELEFGEVSLAKTQNTQANLTSVMHLQMQTVTVLPLIARILKKSSKLDTQNTLETIKWAF